MLDADAGREFLGQVLLEAGDVRVGAGLLLAVGLARGLRGLLVAHAFFQFAHAPAAVRCGECKRGGAGGFKRDQRARMAHFQAMLFEQGAHRFRQVEQAQQIADRGTRAADGFRGLLVRQFEFPDQTAERGSLFERVQVFALDVLDQGHRDGGLVRHFAHHDGHVGQAGLLCGTPATFAGNDFVTVATDTAHDDGLDHALRLDRFGQLGQTFRIHAGARLVAARLQLVRGQGAQLATAGRFGDVAAAGVDAEQGVEAAAEAARFLGRHRGLRQFVGPAAAGLADRSWRSISPARPR